MFKPVPKPESKLARYRLLAPNASVRISPLWLGAMNIGEAWKEGMGSMTKEQAFELLDYYYDQGGNAIDTANNYQNEESEKWIGEWMEGKGIRSEMVIATKWTTGYRVGQNGILVNTAGNSIKNMHESVTASLRKLRTDYIDLLYVHWWDYSCSVEELMQGLNVLVNQGKVLYLGISDTPAWVVSKANQYAKDHGMRGFSVYQGKWSCGFRDLERDVIPMARVEGMAIAPWGALGGGNFKTKAMREEMERSGDKGRNFGPPPPQYEAVTEKLEKIGKKLGYSITGVALAYTMQKTAYVFPIVGGRKISHLKDNIEAIGIRLSDEDIKDIESAYEFDLGFPHTMVGMPSESNSLLKSVAYTDWPILPQPIHSDD